MLYLNNRSLQSTPYKEGNPMRFTMYILGLLAIVVWMKSPYHAGLWTFTWMFFILGRKMSHGVWIGFMIVLLGAAFAFMPDILDPGYQALDIVTTREPSWYFYAAALALLISRTDYMHNDASVQN